MFVPAIVRFRSYCSNLVAGAEADEMEREGKARGVGMCEWMLYVQARKWPFLLDFPPGVVRPKSEVME
jgi:hypothetical protein